MLAWIEELFTVIRIINTQPIIYVLKIDAAKNYKVFFITKIYRKSVTNYCIVLRPFYKNAAVFVDEKSILVKRFGHPLSFNSWISTAKLGRYRD